MSLVCDPSTDGARYAEYSATAAKQAVALRAAADRIGTTTNTIGRQVAAVEFQSPSAADFRRRVEGVDAELRGVTRRLTDLAETLDRTSRHYAELHLDWLAKRGAAGLTGG
ncbi:hypothetical protein [Polymorphospora lycopeni]|uniref:Excreted virulence factor EspC (Type VII ESX diderm) n=1 Tax=Polymorphospora lycopeni TaxID=3140240 RepID=A0ABV5CJP2_9ACTN